MNDQNIYDQFSQDYDRFVNWKERLSAEIPFLISELRPSVKDAQDAVSVLDAACGTGHHAIALAEQNFNCAGADYSSEMIKIARRNAKLANKDIPFKMACFGELVDVFRKGAFDSLICLGNSLPHVLDECSMVNTLSDFRAVLRPAGKLIIQNRNFDKVLVEQERWMDPQTYRENNTTWIFARFYDFDIDGKITFNIQILTSQKGQNYQQQVISTRLWPLTKDVLNKYLQQAGFIDLKFYGDLAGSQFDLYKSGNLVITATST